MKQIYAYVHTHWDREWYREFEDFRLRLIEVFNNVLNLLENNKLPCFYFDGQTAALEDYLEIYPEKLEIIKKYIKEKKLYIGPFYCSSDSFLVSGESLYRNLKIGLEKSKELGERDFIAYIADSFGHSRCLPYILKSQNIDKACLWRGLGNQNADLDWDGIKVTYLIQGYFQDFLNTDYPINQKAELLKKYIDKIAQKSSENILLPIGADHLNIAKNLNEQIKALNEFYKDYKIELASPFEYFNKITERQKVSGEFSDNSRNFLLKGVYSARMNIKKANARSQWYLSRISEPLQAFCTFYFSSQNRQKEIDYAWKLLIKNQAHDSIYGCSTDKVHNEMLTRYSNIDTVCNGVIKRALRDISHKDGKLTAINLSNFNYNGKVFILTEKQLPNWLNAVKIKSYSGFTDEKLYNINEIPITEDITTINEYVIDVKNLESFSMTQITKEHICQELFLETDNDFIENKNIRFEIKKDKIFVTNKLKKETYKDFITITNRADIGDSYNFGPLKNDKPIIGKLIKHKLKEHNRQRAVMELVFEQGIPVSSSNKGRNKKICTHKLYIDVILYNKSEYAEFKINWNNKSANHILQICFNLKEQIRETLNEDLFGITERKFNPNYNIYQHIPSKRGEELKTNTSPMQRFMLAGDFGLITKGNSEYEVRKKSVCLTLLRSTDIISNPENPARGTPAGPPLFEKGLLSTGENSAHFAIAFPKMPNDMYRLAEEFYNPILTLFSNHKDVKFLNLNPNEIAYAVENRKDGLALRTFDLKNKKINNIVIKNKNC